MIRVAIETSTARGGVAVGEGERVLAEVDLGVQRRHAETVLPALESALRLAGVERSAIEGVVVGAGPGSFTGVRVAGATAKGLVAALDVPLLAYSSLLVLAAGVPAAGPVCAVLDARRGEVYGDCWRITRDAVLERVAPRVGPAAELARAVSAADPDAPVPLYIGDGALRYRERLEETGARVATAPAHPAAGTLIWLADRHPALGRVADVSAWEPRYVRASSAERGVAG